MRSKKCEKNLNETFLLRQPTSPVRWPRSMRSHPINPWREAIRRTSNPPRSKPCRQSEPEENRPCRPTPSQPFPRKEQPIRSVPKSLITSRLHRPPQTFRQTGQRNGRRRRSHPKRNERDLHHPCHPTLCPQKRRPTRRIRRKNIMRAQHTHLLRTSPEELPGRRTMLRPKVLSILNSCIE